MSPTPVRVFRTTTGEWFSKIGDGPTRVHAPRDRTRTWIAIDAAKIWPESRGYVVTIEGGEGAAPLVGTPCDVGLGIKGFGIVSGERVPCQPLCPLHQALHETARDLLGAVRAVVHSHIGFDGDVGLVGGKELVALGRVLGELEKGR